MSSTNKTTNYELTQFLATDVPSWLVDYNGDMSKIDTQMKVNATAAASAQSKADGADSKADTNAHDIGVLENELNTPNTGLVARLSDVEGDVDSLQELIGNGTPTTTNRTIIGAINELNADLNGESGVAKDVSAIETLLGNTPLETKAQTITAAINELNGGVATNRKFILIGDSFGYGIRGGGQTWVTGWIDYMKSLLPDNVFALDPAHDSGYEGSASFTAATGVSSPNTFINLLAYIKSNLLGTVKPEEITDIVVIGGNNGDTQHTYSEVYNAVSTFIDTARTDFPNANIKIGCFGLNARLMTRGSSAYSGIFNGAKVKGVDFLKCLLNLGAGTGWDSGYGHLTEEGYNACNPIIAQAVINGHVAFKFTEELALTLASNVEVAGGSGVTYKLWITRTENTVSMAVTLSDRIGAYPLHFTGTYTSGSLTFKAFECASQVYVAFQPYSTIDALFVTTKDTNDNAYLIKGIGSISVYFSDNNNYYPIIQFTTNYPWPNASYGDGSALNFVWNGIPNTSWFDPITF